MHQRELKLQISSSLRWVIYVIYRLGGPYSKNCDPGLENAVLGPKTRAAFSRPRSQPFTVRTSPKTSSD